MTALQYTPANACMRDVNSKLFTMFLSKVIVCNQVCNVSLGKVDLLLEQCRTCEMFLDTTLTGFVATYL